MILQCFLIKLNKQKCGATRANTFSILSRKKNNFFFTRCIFRLNEKNTPERCRHIYAVENFKAKHRNVTEYSGETYACETQVLGCFKSTCYVL